MPLASDLMGLGMAPALASRVGYAKPDPATGYPGSGTAQTGATALGGAFSLLNPSAGNTAYVFANSAPLAKLHPIMNPTGVAAIVYPQAGGTINGGAVNAGISIPANSSALAVQSSLGNWFVNRGA